MTTSSKPHPAARRQELHVPEHLARLLRHVALPHEFPVGVERDDPGDEQQPAGLDRVGVVADRFGQALDAKLLAMLRQGPSYNRRVEPQFVHFADVNAFELAAGVTGRPLFGEGAMLNLIEFEPGSTVRSIVTSTNSSGSSCAGRRC